MRNWVEALEERGGPFAEPAIRFATREFSSDVSEWPRGLDAARSLIRSVRAFHRDTNPDSRHDAFVEEAGAWFAAILIDHYASACHCSHAGEHRVQLGERGFFNPFVAVETILDAEDPRAALVQQLTFAEQEARHRGPISRIVCVFEDVLRECRADVEIVWQFELTVRVAFRERTAINDSLIDASTEIDLRRIARSTNGESLDAVRSAAKRMVDLLPGAHDESSRAILWEEAQTRILPRLVSTDFIASIAKEENTGQLFSKRLGHDVGLALILNYPGRARYVRDHEVQCWHEQGHEVVQTAITNLATKSNRARFLHLSDDVGSWIVAQTGDGLDAARLVLPTLHDVLSAELGSPLWIALPHRDTLLAWSQESLTPRMLEKVREQARAAPHRISEHVFLLTEEGISQDAKLSACT